MRWGARWRPRSFCSGVPPPWRMEPTYHYNLGCYDAVLGNLEEAARHLETSFRMDKKFREIAKYDPDLKAIHGLAGQMTADASAAARVQAIFECNFVRGVEVGASVAVWQDGREAFCFCHGWRDAARECAMDADTMVLVWSATKGLSSACVLHALERCGSSIFQRA